MTLKYTKIRKVLSPVRAHKTDAGFDVFVPEDVGPFLLRQGDSVLIPSGLKFEVPEGRMLQVCNKSGVASKKGLIYGAHVVDSNFAGEFIINLHKVTGEPVVINPNDKIVQLVLTPIEYCDLQEVEEKELYGGKETERNTGGFGSTDK